MSLPVFDSTPSLDRDDQSKGEGFGVVSAFLEHRGTP